MIYFNGLKKKKYFEGWFFRISGDGINCALIPSVSVSDGKKKAYIQVNCNGTSKKLEYDFSDFSANDNECVICGNKFSADGINFESNGLSINVKFGEFTTLSKDIMGCFKFGTPCKHKIISMYHTVSGTIVLDGAEFLLEKAVGYLEKDWGTSFPKGYCWLQCNEFYQNDASFFCSVAKIGLPDLGFICSLIFGGKEYRFATYNFSWIKKLSKGEIILKRGKHILKIEFSQNHQGGSELLAPKFGEMKNTIKEDLSGTLNLRLFENGNLLFQSNGKNAGIEWVNL